MKKFHLVITILLITISTVQAQEKFDFKLIKETVENEKSYYNDILKLYMADDQLLRTDDVALIYYGQSYLPTYNGGNDVNEQTLKTYVSEGNNTKIYNTALKILAYNPVSLNALFYAWLSAQKLNRPETESNSYVHKYFEILNMIVAMGDGKSSDSPFKVISPDDQDHLIYGFLDIQKVSSRNLDTKTLCNIISVTPSEKFPHRTLYIDVSRYLSTTTKKK